jgi:hypothetical protein
MKERKLGKEEDWMEVWQKGPIKKKIKNFIFSRKECFL